MQSTRTFAGHLLVGILKLCLAYEQGHAENSKLRREISKEYSDLLGLARWVYRKNPLKVATLSPSEARTWCFSEAISIRDRKEGRTDARQWAGIVTTRYATRAQKEIGARVPYVPNWQRYAPLVGAQAERALDEARAVYELAALYQADAADGYIDADDIHAQAWDAIVALQSVENWIVDIAMSDDRTASSWEDERSVEERIADEAELDSYVESLDHTSFGKYEAIMEMRLYGERQPTQIMVEDEHGTGFHIDEYSDVDTNPVMIAVDGTGKGIHAVIASERGKAASRLRAGMGKAMPTLALVADERRRLEDRLVFEGEGGTSIPPEAPETRIPLADVRSRQQHSRREVQRLIALWRATDDEHRRRQIKTSGVLARRELDRLTYARRVLEGHNERLGEAPVVLTEDEARKQRLQAIWQMIVDTADPLHFEAEPCNHVSAERGPRAALKYAVEPAVSDIPAPKAGGILKRPATPAPRVIHHPHPSRAPVRALRPDERSAQYALIASDVAEDGYWTDDTLEHYAGFSIPVPPMRSGRVV